MKLSMVHFPSVAMQTGAVGEGEGVEDDSVVEEEVEVVVGSAEDEVVLFHTGSCQSRPETKPRQKIRHQPTGCTKQEHAELTRAASLTHWVWTGAKSLASV